MTIYSILYMYIYTMQLNFNLQTTVNSIQVIYGTLRLSKTQWLYYVISFSDLGLTEKWNVIPTYGYWL